MLLVFLTSRNIYNSALHIDTESHSHSPTLDWPSWGKCEDQTPEHDTPHHFRYFIAFGRIFQLSWKFYKLGYGQVILKVSACLSNYWANSFAENSDFEQFSLCKTENRHISLPHISSRCVSTFYQILSYLLGDKCHDQNDK